MALIGNRSILHKSPGRFLSGTAGTLRSNFNKPGMAANRFEQMSPVFAAVPSGHLSPSAWLLPRTAGGGASRNEAVMTIAATGLIAGGITTTGTASFAVSATSGFAYPLDDTPQTPSGSASFSFTADATGSLITSGAGTAAFSFSATGEALGILNGAGAASFAIYTNAPQMTAIGHAEGSASFAFAASAIALPSNDTPQAPAGVASFSFSGSLVPYAIGHMQGSTEVGGELTANAVALAVWQYATRTLTGAGTLTPEQESQLFELWQVAGLDPTAPVTATKTRRFVGDTLTPDIDQTITGNGRTTSTITRE